ncbi:hypothetical protein [Microvirga calopogonii]|uniref:hypothetical protein n=1 Tax=Microvirga calopogonii TaxID=2078013 RepID=UPI0013B3F80A|nr:hypothetical protein [Microvirga calopogonii]
MMMRLKPLFLAITGLIIASHAGAQTPDRNSDWFVKQEKFNKRIEASNRRATRSVCEDLCKEPRRSVYAEPEDWHEPDTVAEATYEPTPTPYQTQIESDGIQGQSE